MEKIDKEMTTEIGKGLIGVFVNIAKSQPELIKNIMKIVNFVPLEEDFSKLPDSLPNNPQSEQQPETPEDMFNEIFKIVSEKKKCKGNNNMFSGMFDSVKEVCIHYKDNKIEIKIEFNPKKEREEMEE